jgi:hypothetical protein
MWRGHFFLRVPYLYMLGGRKNRCFDDTMSAKTS